MNKTANSSSSESKFTITMIQASSSSIQQSLGPKCHPRCSSLKLSEVLNKSCSQNQIQVVFTIKKADLDYKENEVIINLITHHLTWEAGVTWRSNVTNPGCEPPASWFLILAKCLPPVIISIHQS